MPTIRLDLRDDEEFVFCQYCKLHVQPYNNTSLSTTPIDNMYTKTLLKYHHLNCEKCGLFIELHPKHSTDEGLIFLCSDSIPHKHCLCYECGLLYDLKTDKKRMDILKQLQFNNTMQPTSASIEPQPSSNNVLTTSNFSSVDIVGNSTLIAQVLNAATTSQDDTGSVPTDSQQMSDNDGSTLFIGTIMALLVWLGIYLNSPELFRLTACFLWLSIFYFLTNLYFTDNEHIQRAVFGLFSFSPILGSIYLFEKTRRLKVDELQKDIKLSMQFLCIFGCIVYLSYYWSPKAMYLFLVNDFMKLSVMQQLISLFIAISFGLFILILLKNCKFISTVLSYDDDDNDNLTKKYVDCIDHDCVNQHDLEINQMVQVSTVNQQNNNNNNKNKRKRRKKKKKRKD